MSTKKKKILKITGIVAFVLAVIIAIAGYAIGSYFYNLALNPNSDRSVVFEAPQNQMDDEVNMDEIQALENWFYEEAKYEDVYLTSYDDLQLHAYQIKNENPSNKWAIVCHGYTSEGSHMKDSAKHFYDMGYNILMPDARGHGMSEGDYIGMGWDERHDIVGWASTIADEDADSQILLYGVSMGGATVMMTSGEELPSNVKVIVEDCGYTSVRGIFDYQLTETFGLPTFPIMEFANIVGELKAGYSINQASALEQIKKSITPTLFIHGDEDTFVPYEMVHEVYDAANVEKDILVVPGAGHGEAAKVAGDAYWQKVQEFTSKYITE